MSGYQPLSSVHSLVNYADIPIHVGYFNEDSYNLRKQRWSVLNDLYLKPIVNLKLMRPTVENS